MKQKRIHDFLPNIKDYYIINSNGEIYSDNSGKMKTRNKGNTDYQIINLMTIEGKKKTFRLHRLVLQAFSPIENYDEFEVNHIDGNKLNNSLDNLEWCTASQNQIHAYDLGLQKARKGKDNNFAKLDKQDIEKIFEMRKQGYLQREIAEEIGCTRSNISYILNNKTWQV